jgi:Recombinase
LLNPNFVRSWTAEFWREVSFASIAVHAVWIGWSVFRVNVLDPDKQVQETVRLLFETFARTGSLNATVKSFRQQHLLFPTRVASGAHKGELVWTPLSLGRACTALHNPWYAGAYAFGRSRFGSLKKPSAICRCP